MIQTNVLAVDIGSKIGKVVVVEFKDRKITYDEVYRFDNKPIKKLGILCWDIMNIFEHVKKGISIANNNYCIKSVGIDTWGVDFCLLDESDNLIGLPTHYRDNWTSGIIDKIKPMISLAELYQETGNQIMEINTLFQLFAMKERFPDKFFSAKKLLLIPDLLNYWLTDKMLTEESISSTTQLTNPFSKKWSELILDNFEIPKQMFPEIVKEGHLLGNIQSKHQLNELKVINVCQHDTASTVVAIPDNERFLFISSGEWSLIGTELECPNISSVAQKNNLTNESGHDRTTRLMKNCTGLWIVQELQKVYKEEGTAYNISEIENLVCHNTDFNCIVDINDTRFINPNDIREEMVGCAKMQNQDIPAKPEDYFKCALTSLVSSYNKVIAEIEEAVEYNFETVYITGVGTEWEYLSQLVANETQKKVIVGSVEATAIGNAIIQFIALGKIDSVNKAREIVKNSLEQKEILPRST